VTNSPARGDGDLTDPSFAMRYRIMCSRDTRFDGQFITGVHTTGIYCRPSCPATTPKPGNVSFYLTTAAAHADGLRACKRCLPDAVPGSPAWNMRDDLAARSMRLISDGIVEREGVPGLADRLGYTPRHVTRILVAELGAGPLALARAHRAQTARLLLLNTDLSITDVAFAAGFGSVRQFNDTVATVYGRTPSHVRASRHSQPERQKPGVDPAETTITLELPARAPFDGAGVLRFLRERAVPGVETATDTSYGRTVRLPHGTATLEVTATGTAAVPALSCRIRLTQLVDLAPLVGRLRRLFDLDADATAIDCHLGATPALKESVDLTPGIRVPGSTEAEETLFRALIGQQVSVAAARTALTRLAGALGDRLPGPEQRLLFPTAAQIAASGAAVLRGPRARIETILHVAQALASGSLVVSFAQTRVELEERLVALRGIGPWTAGYVAMRVLGSPDILLTGDLALRQGAGRLGLPVEPRALTAHGADWAPWRSYAGMHLWHAAHSDSLFSPNARAER